MKTIYKSARSKKALITYYEETLANLGLSFSEHTLKTRYGHTHIVEFGSRHLPPLLVLHGLNTNSAYAMHYLKFLSKDFNVFAVDILGKVGKSAEKRLSPRKYDYGFWLSDVIEGLGFESVRALGVSFGAGIITKLMQVHPEQVKRACLINPSGIKNPTLFKRLKLIVPWLSYKLFKREKTIKKLLLPLAHHENAIDTLTYETVKASLKHLKFTTYLPSEAKLKYTKHYENEVYILSAEHDMLFPSDIIKARAKKLFPHVTVDIIRGQGHLLYLSKDYQIAITDFLAS